MSTVAIAGREYVIRSAGVLGPVERRELLAAWERCSAYVERAATTAVDDRALLGDLRLIAGLALVGVPPEVLRQARRRELLDTLETLVVVTCIDVEADLAKAPATRDKYAGKIARIKRKVGLVPAVEV